LIHGLPKIDNLKRGNFTPSHDHFLYTRGLLSWTNSAFSFPGKYLA